MRVRLLYFIIYFFAILNSGFAQSVWELRNSLLSGKDLESVAYGNNQFIAVGGTGTILASPDGVTWTESRLSPELYTFSAVYTTYGNNQFIVVGEGTILTSPDGAVWTKGSSEVFEAVIYGNDQFISVGPYGTIFTSPDGISWTERSSGTTKGLESVTYGNKQFIAVGWEGTIISSKADATTDNINSNLDTKSALPLSITKVSNRLFIQMPNTGHIGKDLRISLFNTTGKTIYIYTEMKIISGKFSFPISGLL